MRLRAAFTVIELLVAIAIIAVLAAILLPVLWAARASARRTVCTSNLRQIGLAMRMYRQDFEEFPPRLSAAEPAYVREPRVYLCPSDRKRGQHDPSPRVEGATWLPTGVSYGYLPNWATAQELGWWRPAPRYGEGKWGDLTPLAECHWHWASTFNPAWSGHLAGSKGWGLLLTSGASVRRVRVEEPVEDFTPERYR